MGRKAVAKFSRRKRLTLVTDVHLGDGTYTDQFGKKDAEFIRLLDHAEATSDALLILGDCFDLLQAPTMMHIARAHPDVMGRLARFARRRKLVILRGNHDYMADVERFLPGTRIVDRAKIGRDVRIEHGDDFDPWGNRETTSVGRWHNFLERITHSHWKMPLRENPDWGSRLLHWAGHKLLIGMRLLQGVFRRLGYKRRARKMGGFVNYWSRTVWGDLNSIFHRIRKRLPRWKRTRVLICGHSHLPGDVRLGRKRYINVGSWSLNNTQYCEYDGADFVLREWSTGRRIGDENYRYLIKHPKLPSFEEWFGRHHKGLLSFRV